MLLPLSMGSGRENMGKSVKSLEPFVHVSLPKAKCLDPTYTHMPRRKFSPTMTPKEEIRMKS